MFKTPSSTCEPQKIIPHTFIKQEFFEVSTETIDYGDHESHSATYQGYGKDTREVDVIDGAIYESFIKREINEQIDDEPLYTSTTSDNCYIECKPTIYDDVKLVGKSQMNDSYEEEMLSKPKFNEPNVPGQPLSTFLDRIPSNRNRTPSVPSSSLNSKFRHSSNNMTSTEMKDSPIVKMSSEPKLNASNVLSQPLNTSLERTPSIRKRTPSSKNKTPSEPSSSLQCKSLHQTPNNMSSAEMKDNPKVKMSSEPKLNASNVLGQPLTTPLDRTASRRKRMLSEPSSSIHSKFRRLSSNNMSSTEMKDSPKVEMSSEPNVQGQPLSTPLDKTLSNRKSTPSEQSSSICSKSRHHSSNKISSIEINDDAKIEMASEPKLNKPNDPGRPLRTFLDRTPSIPSSSLRTESRRLSPNKMSSTEIKDNPKVKVLSEPKLSEPYVQGQPLSTPLDRTLSNQNKTPSVPSSSLRSKSRRHSPNKMSSTEMNHYIKVKMSLEPKLSESNVQGQPLSTPLDRTPSNQNKTPSIPSSSLRSKSRRHSPMFSTEMNHGPKVEMSSEPKINKPNVPGPPLSTSLDRTPSSRKRTTSNRNTSPSSRHRSPISRNRSPLSRNRKPSVLSSSLHYTSRRHSLNNMSSIEMDDGRKVQKSSEPILNEYVTALVKEKYALSAFTHPYTMKLIDEEIVRSINTNRMPESIYLDIHNDNPIRLTAKVIVPVNDFPRINLIPKLLGPKGSSLQQVQKDTKTKMAILGKGSMRDKKKEDELRNSLNPKFAHFADALHVQVNAFATPTEAYARVTSALVELKKFFTLAHKHQIEQEQAHEIEQCGGPLPPKPGVQSMHPVNAMSKSLNKSYGDSGSYRKCQFESGYGDVETYNKDGNYYSGNSYSQDNCYRGSIFNHNWKSKMAESIPYGDVETYNGSGNDDDYFSENSYSQDNNQSGWKNYNNSGSGGSSKPTGNQGSRYGRRNTPYTR